MERMKYSPQLSTVSGNLTRSYANNNTKSGENSQRRYSAKKTSAEKQVWKCLGDYSNSTSLHGVKYIGEPRRPLLERVFWGVVFTISLGICAHLIGKAWKKWQDSPVIVSFSETATPVWDIPFPAVTICPENKVKQDIFNSRKICSKFRRSEKEDLVCSRLYPTCLLQTFIQDTKQLENFFQQIGLAMPKLTDSENNNMYNVSNLLDIITKYSVQQEDTFSICFWQNKIKTCQRLFQPVLTFSGLCFSFNTLTLKELFRNSAEFDGAYLNHEESNGWTLENGYPEEIVKESSYPKRAERPGSTKGLALYLKADRRNVILSCLTQVAGFQVFLHNPVEFPEMRNQFFRVPLEMGTVVSIRPTIIKTSEDLRHYSPEVRQCFYSDERHLKYFRVYTQSNCETECLWNMTLKVCKCLPTYVPRVDEGTSICDIDSKTCYMIRADTLVDSDVTMKQCRCLPSCTEIVYDTESSQSQFVRSLTGKDFHTFSEYRAFLSIYFKTTHFTTVRRSEMYGITDFLANCGGLLGLFCGFSFLSAVEIIYFLSLRWWGNTWMASRSSKVSDVSSKLSDRSFYVPEKELSLYVME